MFQYTYIFVLLVSVYMYFQYFLRVFFNKFEKNSRVHAGRISIGAEHVRTERNTTNMFETVKAVCAHKNS